MNRSISKIALAFCLLTGIAAANDDFNVGVTAVGGVFNLIGLSESGGPRILPGEGGMGGTLSVDGMFPFFADMNLRAGLAAEYRDYRGTETLTLDGKEKTDDVIASLLYLEFPVLVRTHASPTVIVEGGPVVGLNVLAKYYGTHYSEKPKWSDLKEVCSFELGFTANLVLQMTDNLEMTLRVSYMITDVLDEDEVGYDIPSQTFKFQAGFTYWFGGGLAPKNLDEKKTSL